MNSKERKQWRSKLFDRLMAVGVPFRDLAGISDHELWQMKNRRLGWSIEQPRREKLLPLKSQRL